ncbi:Slp family lipoprotein [Alteromonas sp. 1_MG-2023]|uniref:Slp family lipoprotein n=1 Tax=Alteromonas sp. 1_MG-2023 TaxID=3062669 RepID=UPI0026E3B5D9|nr:Slp family lipoprotein [Alteromonas sp. 1_MG-2023]MDO6568684.1 Slp family lipoprotein [Alteromonas sp. 1_MG-2023]
MLVRILVIVSVVLFAGCAIVPESVEVPEGTELVSYTKAVTSGANAQGKTARWGGIIMGVENKPNKTFIELVHFPLNNYGKPNSNGETVGRFKVQIDGFVDPIIFEEGRSATFVGKLVPPTAGMVGEQPYMYPTILADDYHMWRKQDVYDVNMYYFDYATGWYSPFMRHRPWGYSRFGRMRVTRYDNSPSRPREQKKTNRVITVSPSNDKGLNDRKNKQ